MSDANINPRVMFLRDFSQGCRPIGAVAIETRDSKIRYAISVCSPKDKFNRKLARQRALGLLKKEKPVPAAVTLNVVGAMPGSYHDVTSMVMKDIVVRNTDQGTNKTRSYLALVAAQGWLNEADKIRNQIVIAPPAVNDDGNLPDDAN